MDTKHPAHLWSVLVDTLMLMALIVVWAAQRTLVGSGTPAGHATTIAVGMTLQAIPFLSLGVFVAELVEASISPALIACTFPANPMASVLTTLVATLLLPVCDCSVVSISRSPLRKGVPLSTATTLMLASPVTNPLMIVSAYYMFGLWAIVGVRIGLGIIVALPVDLSILTSPPSALREGAHFHDGDSYGCDGGCEIPDHSFSDILGATDHSLGRILPYLLGGVAASTTAQVFQPVSSLFADLPTPGAPAFMMAVGFAPSPCSSSGTVIARLLASLTSQGALTGFMVYGPMMNVKNVVLLSSQFRGTFVPRLFATVTYIATAVIGGAW